MLIDTIDIGNKVLIHEIKNKNFDTFSIFDYNDHKYSDEYKINNGVAKAFNYLPIDDNRVLLVYIPHAVDKVSCKVIRINDLMLEIGPLFSIINDVRTTSIALCRLSGDFFAIISNDTINHTANITVIKVNDGKITTITNQAFVPNTPNTSDHKSTPKNFVAINTADNEITIFCDYKNNCSASLFRFEDNSRIVFVEDQIFYINSTMSCAKIKKVKDFYVLFYINSIRKLIMKVIKVDSKLSFTYSAQFVPDIINNFYQLISIDNEMVLCYFNNVIQIISIVNGLFVQQENIK